MKKWTAFGLLAVLVFIAPVQGADKKPDHPRVELTTSKGVIVLELDTDRAPQTAANFIAYTQAGHFDGTIFHRVIPGFMIQGGGFTKSMQPKTTGKPIVNEADNQLKNVRGTVAMARTSDPHSATAQFFINTVDNDFLNFRGKYPRGWGYAVFGKVVQGMKTVDAISAVKTGVSGPHRDVPLTPVVIVKARLLN